jgi:hypothetical protein
MEEHGAVMPELEATEIWEGGQGYWAAYLSLHRSRGRDMGEPLPIREADLLAYAAATGMPASGIELEEFCEMVRALDEVFLKHAADRRRAAQATAAHSGRPPRAG